MTVSSHDHFIQHVWSLELLDYTLIEQSGILLKQSGF